MREYIRRIVPWLARALPRRDGANQAKPSQLLWQYYWDTIQACVEPASVISALDAAGFKQVQRSVELGIFSEYTARKPA